jgi:signal transduction histidine kinase
MLKTILRNLISNAIKFTKTNGSINVYSFINDDIVEISVVDNGVGISKENQNKLWDLSIQYSTVGTAKERGSGLGLLLCKEFVEKHGGQISVVSEPEKGSEFKFTLPLYQE